MTPEDVERARREGATDLMFCMCNRYVDGLATWAPENPDFYRQRAAKIAAEGYTAVTAAIAYSATTSAA